MRRPDWLERFRGESLFLGLLLFFAFSAWALVEAGLFGYRQLLREADRFQAFAALQRNLGAADSLARRYRELEGRLDEVRRAVPRRNHASHVLDLLMAEAASCGLAITEISGLDEMPRAGARELPFEIAMGGDFPSLARYLHNLESRDMVLQLRRFTIEAEALNRHEIAARLGLSVYLPAEEP